VADRTVYFAKITRGEPRLFDRSFRVDIVDALDPHHPVTRYGRVWRVSRIAEREGGYLAGKLGFVRTHAAEETVYDEERLDFVTTEAIASEGSFSMFVIDPEREIMAFEERPPDIRLRSFLGAFRKLLREKDFPASIDLLSDPSDFIEWARGVERILRVRAVVHRPNPGWNEDAAAFREVVEEADAERAEVVAQAPPEGSLNPDARWIAGALGQVSEQGKGKLTASGVTGETKTRWESGTRLRIAVIRDEDADTPEGVWDWIRQQLREIFGGG
jgi:hypothetical protein